MPLLDALRMAFSMFWEVLWPLVLGSGLSAVIQFFVSHASLAKLLGTDSPRSLTLATLFGIASSSCSYAAVAMAQALSTSRPTLEEDTGCRQVLTRTADLPSS